MLEDSACEDVQVGVVAGNASRGNHRLVSLGLKP